MVAAAFVPSSAFAGAPGDEAFLLDAVDGREHDPLPFPRPEEGSAPARLKLKPAPIESAPTTDEEVEDDENEIFVLLLRPSDRIFEFAGPIRCVPGGSVPSGRRRTRRKTVSDVLSMIPTDAAGSASSSSSLRSFSSAEKGGDGGGAFRDLLSDLSSPTSALAAGMRCGRILVALPEGCPPEAYPELSGTILRDRRVVRLSRRGDAPFPNDGRRRSSVGSTATNSSFEGETPSAEDVRRRILELTNASSAAGRRRSAQGGGGAGAGGGAVDPADMAAGSAARPPAREPAGSSSGGGSDGGGGFTPPLDFPGVRQIAPLPPPSAASSGMRGMRGRPAEALRFSGKSHRRRASAALLQGARYATESMKRLDSGTTIESSKSRSRRRLLMESSRDINQSLQQFSRQSCRDLEQSCRDLEIGITKMEKLNFVSEDGSDGLDDDDDDCDGPAGDDGADTRDETPQKKERAGRARLSSSEKRKRVLLVSRARRVLCSLKSSLGSKASRGSGGGKKSRGDSSMRNSGTTAASTNHSCPSAADPSSPSLPAFQSVTETPEFQMADEETQMEMLVEESRQACLRAVRDHLELFLLETPDVTYEEWIEELHPENARDSRRNMRGGDEIDHRFYVEDSDHRVLWNENLDEEGRREFVPAREEYHGK